MWRVVLVAVAVVLWRYHSGEVGESEPAVDQESSGDGDGYDLDGVLTDALNSAVGAVGLLADPVSAIADQIEIVEGIVAGVPNITEPKTGLTGSRAYRNNNPGNLRSAGDLGYTTEYDRTHSASAKFGVFSSYDLGRAALEADITAKMTGATSTGLGPESTLLDLFQVYAPASDSNDPVAYANAVAAGIGATISATLGSLLGYA